MFFICLIKKYKKKKNKIVLKKFECIDLVVAFEVMDLVDKASSANLIDLYSVHVIIIFIY